MMYTKIAESLFAKYLNDNEIPFYRIDQTIETYSDQLSNNEIRRPDFIVHLNKEILYIDVKYRKKWFLIAKMKNDFTLIDLK